MAIEIRVPVLGESVTEATVGKWYKKVGDRITIDEPLLELETDKVTLDVPAPVSGQLETILAKAGDVIEAGALLGMIAAGSLEQNFVSHQLHSEKLDSKKLEDSHLEVSVPISDPQRFYERSPSPAAQKLLQEGQIDPVGVIGSGKGGQILKGDVLEYLTQHRPISGQELPRVAAKSMHETMHETIAKSMHETMHETVKNEAQKNEVGVERVRMTKLRQTIAKRLKDAQNSAAMLTTFNEVDMSTIMNLRKLYGNLFEKKHSIKLGFMGFFTKAVCHALKEIPSMNAEIDQDEIVYKHYAHIGIAVGTEKGLVVPVVRNADRMSLAEIEKEIGRLGQLARSGKLSISDLQGGSFTITNGGIYGSLMSTPILNAPQSAILGMHMIKERPVVVAGQIVIRPMMYLAVSYDHRIIDGQEAVTFLVRIKESLENPERLVLDL